MNRTNLLGGLMVVLALALGAVLVTALYQWEGRIRAEQPGVFSVSAPAESSPTPRVLARANPGEAPVPTATPTPAPSAVPVSTTAPPDSPTPVATVAPAATAEIPTATPQAPPPSQAVSFQKDILPIFQKSCAACHGTLGGLSLKDYNSLMSTGAHKPQVVPGSPEESLLLKRLTQAPLMPPGRALPDEQVQKIAQWVEEGAANN